MELKPPAARGKALFLDTMGFQDPKVMGGCPTEADSVAVAESYGSKLLPRHWVLARLAREGLCTTLLTTNYDLLLEGALRLAGCELDAGGRTPSVATTFAGVNRVARASDFFDRASGYRSVLLVKIHGCVDAYRKSSSKPASWQAYLPAMVFTYREIQNWRTDAWSRDYVRTLLRTRCVVFCGYSTSDPVLHDTFRSVYEEMAVKRLQAGPALGSVSQSGMPAGHDAAYLFGLAENREFHGQEVLRAAARACKNPAAEGVEPSNYIPFSRRGKGFPSLDEAFLWTFHRVFRGLQTLAIESELLRSASAMLGRRVPAAEVEAVKTSFDQLFSAECQSAALWRGASGDKYQLLRICNWTYEFQPRLLREFALKEAAEHRRSPGAREQLRSRFGDGWYYPATERKDWTAWAAVVELAIRRLAATLQKRSASWLEDDPRLVVGPGPCPCVCFTKTERQGPPVALAAYYAGTGMITRLKVPTQGLVRTVHWPLGSGASVWPGAQGSSDAVAEKALGNGASAPASEQVCSTPAAEVLWRWVWRSEPGDADAAEEVLFGSKSGSSL